MFLFLFFASNLSWPLGAAMLIHSWPTKSRKWLTRDVFHIFVTHAGLLYDVSDKTAEHKMITLTVVFSRLWHNDFLTNRVRRKKNRMKKLLFIFLIPSTLIGPVKFLLYYVRLVSVCTVPFTVLSPSRTCSTHFKGTSLLETCFLQENSIKNIVFNLFLLVLPSV